MKRFFRENGLSLVLFWMFFLTFLVGQTLVGHLPAAYNALFDRKFMHAEMARAGVLRDADRVEDVRPLPGHAVPGVPEDILPAQPVELQPLHRAAVRARNEEPALVGRLELPLDPAQPPDRRG